MINRVPPKWIISAILCFMLVSCGYKLSGNANHYPDVNFTFSNNETKRDIIKSRIFFGILAIAKDAKAGDDYYCEITSIKISNTRLATNASGDADSYKLFVEIDYKLFDKSRNMIGKSSYNLVDIYEIDESLYSSEVKNNQIIDTIPKSFLNHIYQKLLLNM